MNSFQVFKIENMTAYEETMLISLYANNVSTGFNTLIAKFDSPPTLNDFDFISNSVQVSSQNLVIDSTKNGNYYVGVQNYGATGLAAQAIVAINIRIAKFEIFDFYPKSILKGYNTTVKIRGSRFGKNLACFLESESVRLDAIEVTRVSSQIIFATFLSADQSEKLYQLVLFDLDVNQTAKIDGLFVQNQGSPGKLRVKINMGPLSGARAPNPISWSLWLENIGESDLKTSFIMIASDGKSIFTLVQNDLDLNKHDELLLFYAFNDQGLPNLIQPGSYIKFDFQSLPKLGSTFSRSNITVVNQLDKAIETDHLKKVLKPMSIDNEIWNIIWNNKEAIFNEDYNENTIRLLNCFASKKRFLYSFLDLIKYQVDYANNRLSGKYLVSFNDLNAYDFDITRHYSNFISIRRSKGLFGYGWFTGLLDIRILNMSTNSFVLLMEREEMILTSTNNIDYSNQILNGRIDSKYIYVMDSRTTYYFDITLQNRLIKIAGIDGDVFDFEYNQQNQLVKISNSRFKTSIDLTYNQRSCITLLKLFNKENKIVKQITFKYDESGEFLMQVSDLSSKTTNYEYDNDGDLTKISFSTGEIIKYNYDTRTKFINMIDAYNSSNQLIQRVEVNLKNNFCQIEIKSMSQNSSTLKSYDENFALTETLTDELKLNWEQVGNSYRNRHVIANDDTLALKEYFDEKTGMLTQTFADNVERKLIFDRNTGQLIKIIDPNENELEMTYNQNKSLTKILHPDGKSMKFEYNQNNLVETLTKRDESKINFTYDSFGRVISKLIDNEKRSDITYNAQNQIVKISSPLTGETKIDYNENGLPVKILLPTLDSIEYGYDSKLRRVWLKTSQGYHLKYEFNTVDQFWKIIDGNSSITLIEYKYDDRGRLIEELRSDKSRVQYEYYSGSLNQIKAIQIILPNNKTLHSFQYFYNSKGHRTKIVKDNETFLYKYDSIGQIISFEKYNQSEKWAYEYDSNFNRRKVLQNDTLKSIYYTNNLNQYIQVETRLYKYDDSGNLMSDGVHSYEYNVENKVVRIDDCQLEYDHFNNVNKMTCSDGQVKHFITDPFGLYGYDLLDEISINSSFVDVTHYLSSRYGGMFAIQTTSDIFFYNFDLDANTVSISESSQVYNSYSYDPFGQVIECTENLQAKNRFKFLAKYGIFELKRDVYLNRARLYDASIARFLSMDPSGFTGSTYNSYAYANNNPMELRDLNGENSRAVTVGTAVIINAYTNGMTYALSNIQGLNCYNGDCSKQAGFYIALGSGAIQGLLYAGGPVVGYVGGIVVSVGASALEKYINGEPITLEELFVDASYTVITSSFITLGKIAKDLRKLKDPKVAYGPPPQEKPTLGGSAIENGIGNGFQAYCEKAKCDKAGDSTVNWPTAYDPNDMSGK
jgi:RHS repeat-associated protein